MSLSGWAKKVQENNRSDSSPSPPRGRPDAPTKVRQPSNLRKQEGGGSSSSNGGHIDVNGRNHNNEPIRTLSSGNDEDSPFSNHNDTTSHVPVSNYLSCPHCKRSFSAPANLQNYNIAGHQTSSSVHRPPMPRTNNNSYQKPTAENLPEEMDLPKKPNFKDILTKNLPPEPIEEKVEADQEKSDGPWEIVESKKGKKKRNVEEAQVSNSQRRGNGGRNKSKHRKN